MRSDLQENEVVEEFLTFFTPDPRLSSAEVRQAALSWGKKISLKRVDLARAPIKGRLRTPPKMPLLAKKKLRNKLRDKEQLRGDPGFSPLPKVFTGRPKATKRNPYPDPSPERE